LGTLLKRIAVPGDSGNCFRMLVGMNNNQNVGDHIQIFSSKQTPSGRQRIASDTASEIDQNSLLRRKRIGSDGHAAKEGGVIIVLRRSVDGR
ncbi:hypothetical protein, partial [Pseudomonas putida]|uniref:hypothetical protein n=1 Tax=Pseudomonas putida TaxID=303 RepID=UPI00195551E7